MKSLEHKGERDEEGERCVPLTMCVVLLGPSQPHLLADPEHSEKAEVQAGQALNCPTS